MNKQNKFKVEVQPNPIFGVAPNKWINLTRYSGFFWNGYAFSLPKSPL